MEVLQTGCLLISATPRKVIWFIRLYIFYKLFYPLNYLSEYVVEKGQYNKQLASTNSGTLIGNTGITHLFRLAPTIRLT